MRGEIKQSFSCFSKSCMKCILDINLENEIQWLYIGQLKEIIWRKIFFWALGQSTRIDKTILIMGSLTLQEHSSRGVLLKKTCSWKCCKIHRKITVPEPFFNEIAASGQQHFKNDSDTGLSCEFWEIFKTSFSLRRTLDDCFWCTKSQVQR